ncbi:MAG: bifunctional hydroxymethylpyrimidine kinase/phosphomethylpyrimidine kinase [Chloroflexi bacterium]|nr:bifunctional hydroxymethylpyrimidine kinase/phosphomethylpyrimidine kinase [Chloroflexota bacterium]|tara:strand:- start:4923 stop:5759 length:837 start_codon:yes stop_codon:yes gene_type:complete
MKNSHPIALTIAGSDSGAGAGVQADLKTFAAFGVYGISTLTAITSQNTLGVQEVLELPTQIIRTQLDALTTDFNINAIKIGMLSSTSIIEAVVSKIKEHKLKNLIIDPVMVAKGGDHLLRQDAVNSLSTSLLPLALVVTPNAHEAEVLTRRKITNLDDARYAARAIHDLGARNVVIKGGHFGENATDLLFDGADFSQFTSPRVITKSTHGTGCTLSSAIASGIALEKSVYDSVSIAKNYVYNAILKAVPIGHGHGPLNHFYHHKNQNVKIAHKASTIG